MVWSNNKVIPICQPTSSLLTIGADRALITKTNILQFTSIVLMPYWRVRVAGRRGGTADCARVKRVDCRLWSGVVGEVRTEELVKKWSESECATLQALACLMVGLGDSAWEERNLSPSAISTAVLTGVVGNLFINIHSRWSTTSLTTEANG